MAVGKATIKKIEKQIKELRAAHPVVERMITVPWPMDIYSEEGEKYIQEEIERRDRIRKEYEIYTDEPYYVIMPGKMPEWAIEEWEKEQEEKKLK